MLAATAMLASALQGQGSRPLQVDDLLDLEQLGSVAASPDGQWLAVVIVRAAAGAPAYPDFPFDNDRADIWLLARHGRERLNLTNGAGDGSGSWNPVWSPDGKRLALLSTKGGGDIRPYVYDLANGTLRRLTERGAEYLRAVGDDGWPSYAMVWSDATTLLCPVRAHSAPPSHLMSRKRSYVIAEQEWAKAAKGVAPTASVLESGREVPPAERPQGALLAIDVTSGKGRIVAEGNIRRLLVSPTRRHVAVIAESGRIPPRTGRVMPSAGRVYELWRTRLGILALRPNALATWVDVVIDPKVTETGASHQWSADGLALAVIGKSSRDEETATTLSLVSAATGVSRTLARQELEAAAVVWSAGGDLLIFARRRRSMLSETDTMRFDWWSVDRRGNGAARKLTGQWKEVPPTLIRTPIAQRVVGISSGRLWSLDAHTGKADDVIHGPGPEIESVVWPLDHGSRSQQDLIVETRDRKLHRVAWKGGRADLVELRRPSMRATLARFVPEHDLAVFTASERSGTYLWTADSSSNQPRLRLALNTELNSIADARRILIKYRDVEGDSLQGLLLLPVGYQQGRRYPLITSVYGGLVIRDTASPSSPLFRKDLVSGENLHLLPARGYALLIPSIPLPPHGQASDPWIDLPKGVMAAVDRVIDLGIADPERLGVMGHSYGGYSVYTLLTYTRRFKVAIASAGIANLVSLYGSMPPGARYGEYAHEDQFFAGYSETGQGRMGVPPWHDLWRYLHNSPLFYVDRMQTPLMIMHGDMDFVSMQQGEEVFSALYRQGKEAKFVRYWGEGHVISSPANIRDLWQRRFAWLDEHLKDIVETSTPSTSGSR